MKELKKMMSVTENIDANMEIDKAAYCLFELPNELVFFLRGMRSPKHAIAITPNANTVKDGVAMKRQ